MKGVWLNLLFLIVDILSSEWFRIVFVISLGLIVFIAIYRAIKLTALTKIMYDRSFSTDGVFVGETLELVETVKNPTCVPLFSVKIVFFMPCGVIIDGKECVEYTQLTSIFNLPPFSIVTKTHTVKADKRAHYKLHSASIKYRKLECTFDSPTDFYAYPNRYDADLNLSADIYRAGNTISHRKYIEDPIFISGIREYRVGDPMRAINFKASVRSFSGGVRRLMCNEYDSSYNYDSMIFLDISSYPESDMNEQRIELGLSYACYLFCMALKNGGNVGFCSNCATDSSSYVHIPCASSDIHTKRILEQFAEISPYAKRDYSMSALLEKAYAKLPKSADIYLITPFVDEKTRKMLTALSRMGRCVQVISLQ